MVPNQRSLLWSFDILFALESFLSLSEVKTTRYPQVISSGNWGQISLLVFADDFRYLVRLCHIHVHTRPHRHS
jgi:hypothetical protein